MTSFALSRRQVCLGLLAAGLPVANARAEVRFTDVRGRVVSLPKPAERIVALPIPMASMVIALDRSVRRLVGVHPSALQSAREGFLHRMFPAAARLRADVIRGSGFVPNIESILSMRPDAVLQWMAPPSSIRMLDDARLRAVGLHESPSNQDIHERNLMAVARVIGQEARGNALIARQRTALAAVKTAVRGLPPVRALYLNRAQRSLVPGRARSYQSFWLNLAGGQNVASSFTTNGTVNAEQMLAWKPEIIFVGAFDAATPQDIYRTPAFATLPAVRNRRVYKLPHGGYRWDPANQESHLTWMWAAMLMNPAQVRFDLRKHMYDTYQFLYGHTLTNAQMDEILAVPQNRGSRFYDRFLPS